MTVPRAQGEAEVLIRRLDSELPLPAYAHPGDAGADLVTAVDIDLAPGERLLVPTGIAIALPDGYAAFVHPRSGLAAEFGLSIVNAPGTVDAGYRGEVKVLLINHDPVQRVQLRRGHRIAQLVVQRVEHVRFHEVQVLPGSARGEGGYGSTGGSLRSTSARTAAASQGAAATASTAARVSAPPVPAADVPTEEPDVAAADATPPRQPPRGAAPGRQAAAREQAERDLAAREAAARE